MVEVASWERDADLWLSLLSKPSVSWPVGFISYSFPTDEVKNLILGKSLNSFEVNLMLRSFLSIGPDLGLDKLMLGSLVKDPNSSMLIEKKEFYKRLINPGRPTWEGMTWVIDLLPHYPKRAIDALDGYFMANCQFLPDGRIHGLGDAMALVRSFFLRPITTNTLSTEISDRDFELLIATAFFKRGYHVTVTRRSKDGGYDVLAEKQSNSSTERLLIECKLYSKNVGVRIAREILGVLSSRHDTKACIVTTAGFTRGVYEIAKQTARLDLIGRSELSEMLNSEFGLQWPKRIDQILVEARTRFQN